MFPELYRDRTEHKVESETKLVVEQAKIEADEIIGLLQAKTAKQAQAPEGGMVH